MNRNRLAALVAVGALTLAACNGDDDGESPEPRPTVTVVATASPSPSSTDPAATPAPLDIPAEAVSASATSDPSEDAQGNPVDYSVAYLVDGSEDTTWRADGDGVGLEIVFDLGAEAVLTEVGLIPGYAKYEGEIDRFHQNRRILTVEWDFADGTSVTQEFADEPTMQMVPVDTTTHWVRLRITETSEHGGRDYTAISELEIVGLPIDS